MSSGSWRSITSVYDEKRSSLERRAISEPDYDYTRRLYQKEAMSRKYFVCRIYIIIFKAVGCYWGQQWASFPGAFVVGTRGCTWFVRVPSNNYTISSTDKWISRGGARTVGVCTAQREEQGPPHVLRHVRLPHGRCPNLWQPAASQLNRPSFHKTIQTPRCPQQ